MTPLVDALLISLDGGDDEVLLVLADICEEEGDQKGSEAWRWLAHSRVRPVFDLGKWWVDGPGEGPHSSPRQIQEGLHRRLGLGCWNIPFSTRMKAMLAIWETLKELEGPLP